MGDDGHLHQSLKVIFFSRRGAPSSRLRSPASDGLGLSDRLMEMAKGIRPPPGMPFDQERPPPDRMERGLEFEVGGESKDLLRENDSPTTMNKGKETLFWGVGRVSFCWGSPQLMLGSRGTRWPLVSRGALAWRDHLLKTSSKVWSLGQTQWEALAPETKMKARWAD